MGERAKLRHFAITTADPEKTAKFYREAFGMDEVGRTDSPIPRTRRGDLRHHRARLGRRGEGREDPRRRRRITESVPPTMAMTVGIAGLGTIGLPVARALAAGIPELELVAVASGRRTRAAPLQ